MSRQFPPALLVLVLGVMLTGNAFAGTYYIAANGSDTNNGSQTAPWAHLPGMQTWAGSYTPAAGDTFILRGCDVWGNSNFPIIWSWSGSNGNPITIDRNTSWYNTANCPSGWNRAIFDAGNSPMGGPECQGNDGNQFVHFNGSNVTMKWIEAKDLYWNDDAGNSCFKSVGWFEANSVDYVTVDSWYLHHWTAGSSATDTDQLVFINGNPSCPHCLLTNFVADNSDATNPGGPYYGGSLAWPNVTNSIIHEITNAIKPWFAGEIGGNNIYHVGPSFQPGIHENCIETIGAVGNGGVYYIHDNVIHDNYQCEGLQVGNSGETDYVWNNVWYNPLGVGANGPQVPQSETPVSMYFWNNTVVGWPFCIKNAGHGSNYSGTFSAINNHCINGNASITDGTFTAGTVTISNNVGMTPATAATQGFTSTELNAYAPTSNTNSTIAAGMNLSSSWPTSSAAGTKFTTNDTTYACFQQTVNGVVQSVCPARSPNTRTSTWDAGAYLFSSSGAAPAPPTGLAVSVQ